MLVSNLSSYRSCLTAKIIIHCKQEVGLILVDRVRHIKICIDPFLSDQFTRSEKKELKLKFGVD